MEKAEEARSILSDLEALNELQSTLEKEDNHWWSLLTPDSKRRNENGIRMPEILREEFVEAVKRAIEKTKESLKELNMETIIRRFGEDFIRAIADFSKCVAESAEAIAQTIVQIGDDLDKALGYDFGVTATHIVYILDKNEKFRRIAKNLITLYGLDGIRLFYSQLFPVHLYGGRTYFLVNTYNADCITDDFIRPKPYAGHSEPKHRIPCKPIPGFKRQNQWKRIRSNPKLR